MGFRSRARVAALSLAVPLVSSAPGAAYARDAMTCAADAENAQSLRQKKKLVQAQRLLVGCADAACPRFVRADCLRWLEELQATMPSIVVRAATADGQDVIAGTVSVDGAPNGSFGISIPLDPGPHTVTVKSDTGEGEQRILVAEGEKNRVIVVGMTPRSVATSPGPTTPASSNAPNKIVAPPDEREERAPTPWTWVAGGVGIAGFAAFGALQLTAQAQYDDLKSSCGKACDPDEVDSVRGKVTMSAVALGVGVVGVATGIVLYFTTRGKAGSATSAQGVGIRF